MKRFLAFTLALVMMLGMFAACGEKKETPAENTPDDTPTEKDVPYSSGKEFADAVQEALVVVAEAFYDRGAYLQYDDSSLVASLSGMTAIRRPDRLKYNPENASSQFTWYTNCASWTYDVYYQALGIDIVSWTTASLQQATDMQVWSYTVSDNITDAAREKTFETFSSQLQPGDILVCRHKYGNAGHALLYIGDGEILHSAAGYTANYDYAKMTEYYEEEGTVMRKTLESLMDTSDKYYFFGEKWWGIIRPTLRYTDAQPTEETVNRVNNMQKIVAEKQTTATVGHTVKAGDEITFTFQVENRRDTETVVEIIENVPANTTIVSAGTGKVEGNVVKWTVGIPAGETKTCSYTVKVNDGVKLGDVIESDSTIDGVRVNCRPVYVGGNLSVEQQAKLVEELEKVTEYGGVSDTDFAEQIYAAIGVTIELDGAKAICTDILTAYGGTKTHFAINSESKNLNMLAPTLYGGYYTVTDTSRWGSYRTKGLLSCQLMIGDILICTPKVGKTIACMYAGEGRLFTITSSKFGMQDVEATDGILETILGYGRFVVIRPAMALYN